MNSLILSNVLVPENLIPFLPINSFIVGLKGIYYFYILEYEKNDQKTSNIMDNKNENV